MANIITISRIILSIALLFCPALSAGFFTVYLLAGASDMIDGAVARRTDTVSGFGSSLDTIADFILVAVCLIKLIPVLKLAKWIYIWIGVIALIKVLNIIIGTVRLKKLIAVHSVMNKAAGALLFVFPLTLPVIDIRYSSVFVCAAASCAAVSESLLLIREDRNSNRSAGSV